MATSAELCIRDRAVLESIFNPSLPFSVAEDEIRAADEAKDVEEGYDGADEEVSKLKGNAIKAAEAEQYEESLKLLCQCIELSPQLHSAYNDRAQVYRLMGNVEAAKADLDTAITLSNGQGSVACKAFTQRAMIRRLEGDDEGCRSDFKHAADLGSSFAKKQLNLLNPYAAMCNAMLSEMVTKLRDGEPTDSGDPAA